MNQTLVLSSDQKAGYGRPEAGSIHGVQVLVSAISQAVGKPERPALIHDLFYYYGRCLDDSCHLNFLNLGDNFTFNNPGDLNFFRNSFRFGHNSGYFNFLWLASYDQ